MCLETTLNKLNEIIEQQAKRIRDLEELYAAATKALNSQIEINDKLKAENVKLIEGQQAMLTAGSGGKVVD